MLPLMITGMEAGHTHTLFSHVDPPRHCIVCTQPAAPGLIIGQHMLSIITCDVVSQVVAGADNLYFHSNNLVARVCALGVF